MARGFGAALTIAVVLMLVVAAIPVGAQTMPGPSGPISPPQSPLPPTTDRIQPSGQHPSTYTHPTRGFVFPMPPGTQGEERGDSFFHVQARNGYVISIQSADAKPDRSMRDLMQRLEATNVGPDKRWRSKIGENHATVAGLPAFESVYDGLSTRARVVIVRGPRTDHVLMFLAPPERFDELTSVFDWVLENFRPGPDDQPPPGIRAGQGAVPSSRPRGAATQPPRRAPRDPVAEPHSLRSTAKTGMQRFAEARYGYEIDYPAEWVATLEGLHTVVFAGKPGTDAYQSAVSIQNVQLSAANTPAEAATAALAEIKQTLAAAAGDLKFEAETPLFREDEGGRLSGRQFLVSYTHGGERFRKWAIVMPRRAGTVAYIWAYTAPLDHFDRFRPLAEKMLDSWNIARR